MRRIGLVVIVAVSFVRAALKVEGQPSKRARPTPGRGFRWYSIQGLCGSAGYHGVTR